MKGTIRILAIAAIALVSLGLASTAHAAADPTFYIRTNQAAYVPGDSGQLLITIRNEGDQAFTIKNMTIQWPWMSFITDHWDGNVTITNINQPIASNGGVYNTQQSFAIPTDGRARTGQGTVRIGTDLNNPYRTSSFTIGVSIPTYTPLGVSTSIFSIILIGIMAIVTILLFMVHQGLKRTRATSH